MVTHWDSHPVWKMPCNLAIRCSSATMLLCEKGLIMVRRIMWADLDRAARKDIPAKINEIMLTRAVCKVRKGKAMPVRGHGGPYGCEVLRLPHFSRQVAHIWWWGCQAYAPTALNPQEDSWYSFLLQIEFTWGSVWLEGLGQLKNQMTMGIEPVTFIPQ
jgi:hypothetical protein